MKDLFSKIDSILEREYKNSPVYTEDLDMDGDFLFEDEDLTEDEEPNGDVFEMLIEEDEDGDCECGKSGDDCECGKDEGIDSDLDDDEWLSEDVDIDPQTWLLAFADIIESSDGLSEEKVLTPDNIRSAGGLPSWFLIPPKWVGEIKDDFPDSMHMWWAAVGETLRQGKAFDLRDPKSLKPIYGRVVKKWKKAIEGKYGHVPQASKGTSIKKDVEDAIKEMGKTLKAKAAGKQISPASMKKAVKMANAIARDQIQIFRRMNKGKQTDFSKLDLDIPKGMKTSAAPDTSASGEGKSANKAEIKRAADEWVSKVSAKISPPGSGMSLSIQPGRKYLRVVREAGGSRSAFAFIDKSNGDIYKAADWKRPAKHARGNVLSDQAGMEAMSGGSIRRMKPGRKRA